MKKATVLGLLGLGFLFAVKSPPSPATPPPSYQGGTDALPSQSQADAILNAPNAVTALQIAAQSNMRIVNNPEVAAANHAAGVLDLSSGSGIPTVSAADQSSALARLTEANQLNASQPVDTSPYSLSGVNPWSPQGNIYPQLINGVTVSSPNQLEVLRYQWNDAHQVFMRNQALSR